jgi:hypothetical protein
MYAGYYNEAPTHLSLGKDTPISRPIEQLVASLPSPCSAVCIIAALESSFQQGQQAPRRTSAQYVHPMTENKILSF